MTPYEIQCFVLESVAKEQFVEPIGSEVALRLRDFTSKDAFGILFGTQAPAIHLFLQEIDPKHPEVLSVTDGVFGETLIQICEHIEHAIAQKHDINLINSFTCMTYRVLPKDLIKKITPPSCDPYHGVRLVSNQKQRWDIRKKRSIINLSGIDPQKLDAVISTHPESFELFVRGNDVYKDQIPKVQRMVERYKKLNVPEMCSVAEDALQSMYDQMHDKHYCFNRCNFLSAMAVLAKMTNCKNNFKAIPIRKDDGPSLVMRLINELEKFSGAGEFTIFDHYFIITNGTGAYPLLGERDGKCYFIGFWM